MAEMCESSLDDLNLSSDELNQLKNAFQDKNFLKLFEDYVQDINSTESRQKYEKEVILLEKDRGYDVKFIHPTSCYVLKFSSNGKKTFINLCQNEYVGKPSSEMKNGGTQWKIPVILSKPRDDRDKKGTKCTVYDVMFHPDTIEHSSKSNRFKRMVEETALSMISENFGVIFDLQAAKYPNLKYKGKAPHVVLRKKFGSEATNVTCEPLEEFWKKNIQSNIVPTKESVKSSPPVTPKYIIKYRDIIDMKDFSLMGYTDKCAPKEIVIEIMLPGVQNSCDVVLDVFERRVCLKSSDYTNHHYKLDLNLSYAVNTDEGKAKFDKTTCKLLITLPLKDRGIPECFNKA